MSESRLSDASRFRDACRGAKAEIRFRNACRGAYTVFDANRNELSDVSPRVWSALRILDGMSSDPIRLLEGAFYRAHHFLGPPDDFGFCPPCADAIRELYDAWDAHLAATADSPVVVIKPS